MSIAQFIDHTILKQTTGKEDVQKVCEEAREYGFAAVCIPPVYVKDGRKHLMGSEVKLATVIGFPFGYHKIETKAEEARQALADGADELDMVMNLSAFKNNDLNHLEKEVTALLDMTRKQKKALKIIIESGILTDKEIVRCCELYRNFDIQFLKTSTGYAEKGASVEAVRIMRENLPEQIEIKASGGIRDFSFAKELLDAGATRLGCSASIAIVKGGTGREGY